MTNEEFVKQCSGRELVQEFESVIQNSDISDYGFPCFREPSRGYVYVRDLRELLRAELLRRLAQ